MGCEGVSSDPLYQMQYKNGDTVQTMIYVRFP